MNPEAQRLPFIYKQPRTKIQTRSTVVSQNILSSFGDSIICHRAFLRGICFTPRAFLRLLLFVPRRAFLPLALFILHRAFLSMISPYM